MNKDISIIIPCFNEAKRLPKTLKIISGFLSSADYSYEIVVVNDGSEDETVERAKELKVKGLRVLGYKVNRGKGYAVNFGVSRSRGRYILFADADNSTPFEQIEKLLSFTDKYKVIIGSRYLRESNIRVKQSVARRIGARVGNLLIRMILLPRVKDTQCGFKLFERRAAKRIFARQTIWRWGFDIELLYIAKKLGYEVKEVPVDWYNDVGTRVGSPLVFISTFYELLKIKFNSLQKKYRG